MSDMRFVLRCALLLLAFVGLATIVDHCTTPAVDDDGIDQRAGLSDDFSATPRRAENGKNTLPVQPLVVLALGLAAFSAYRSKRFTRIFKAGVETRFWARLILRSFLERSPSGYPANLRCRRRIGSCHR